MLDLEFVEDVKLEAVPASLAEELCAVDQVREQTEWVAFGSFV
ncbi:hypothetical protein [Cryptosporangium minutisporangium]|uniref:Uncharacterized protein n=1 Tax=Cryptosporangium minutisporangium TaxID=113569 RepID=A0ABP6SVD0_9ACTN